MTGGLFDPLGTDRVEPRRDDDGVAAGRIPRPSALVLTAGVMVAALATLIVVSWLRDSGDRGQPVAVGPIERLSAPPKPPVPPPAPPIVPPSPTGAAVNAPEGGRPARADEDVEIQNGVRIVRPRRGLPALPGQTLSVPGAAPDSGSAR